MTTDERVDRVAYVIWRDDYFRSLGNYPEDEDGGAVVWEDIPKFRRDVYCKTAIATIAALDDEPLEDLLKEAAALGREGVSINYSDDAAWGPWYAVIEYDAFSLDDGQGETAAEAIRNAVKAAQESE